MYKGFRNIKDYLRKTAVKEKGWFEHRRGRAEIML